MNVLYIEVHPIRFLDEVTTKFNFKVHVHIFTFHYYSEYFCPPLVINNPEQSLVMQIDPYFTRDTSKSRSYNFLQC